LNKDKDYYKILKISTDADKKEIKKAYRNLARKFHPDINRGNRFSEEKFKEIGEAYSVLIDDNKRAQYDLLREIISSGSSRTEQARKQASEAYSSNASKTNKNAANKLNFSEILRKVSASFGQRQKFTQTSETVKPQKGEDIIADIKVSISEAHSGTVRKVNILRTEYCSKCRGKRLLNGGACINCNGSGEISHHKQLSVKIPANVKEGSKIRITGEGNKSPNNGENGDLYLLVHIIKSSLFEFEGVNVLIEIPISPTEAALGSEIQVPTIDGFVQMKIPPETQSGQKFKLAGEGLPDSSSDKRGDQIVTIRIEIPSSLTEKEKELYRELGRTRKFNPREYLKFE
jgi:DnaJ-class molecular chaperone